MDPPKESLSRFALRLRRRWLREAPRYWWGDALDVRFVAAHELQSLRAGMVLDVGCGCGMVLSELDRGLVKVGLDEDWDCLALARRNDASASFTRASAEALPFRQETFDVVLAFGLIEFLVDKKGFIAQAHDLLKPAGKLVLTTNNRGYWGYRNHSRFLHVKDVADLLEPYFQCTVYGFNHIPPFPYFLPKPLLTRLPWMWCLLKTLMKREVARDRCFGVYVVGVKR